MEWPFNINYLLDCLWHACADEIYEDLHTISNVAVEVAGEHCVLV